MRYPEKRYSRKSIIIAALLTFVCGIFVGVSFYQSVIVRAKVKGTISISDNVRTQVKFLPFPPKQMLKNDTIVWIDPGWEVVGATPGHLILKMRERE